MVTKREALEELKFKDLQRLAERLGVQVSHGVAGALTKAMFGTTTESRRAYVEALSNSDAVTLESIDRVLHTRYSRLPDDTRGLAKTPGQSGGLFGLLSPHQPEVSRFYTLDSLLQHIVNEYVTKTDLQKLCGNLGLAVNGNKGDIATRLFNDPRLTKEMVLYFVDRNNMRKLCEDLRLPGVGTRKEMESRVTNAMARLPRAPKAPPAYEQPPTPERMAQTYQVTHQASYPQTPQRPVSHTYTQNPVPQGYSSANDAPSGQNAPSPPEYAHNAPSAPPVPESPPVPTIPVRPELDEVVRFISDWRPTKPYRDEVGYEVELDTRLRTQFGDACVKNQLHVLDGRIDIEVVGIGIELKVPTNKAMLQRLVGQTMMYRKHYGPNLIVVIITGKAKLQDVLAFKNDLELAGTTVVVKSG